MFATFPASIVVIFFGRVGTLPWCVWSFLLSLPLRPLFLVASRFPSVDSIDDDVFLCIHGIVRTAVERLQRIQVQATAVGV